MRFNEGTTRADEIAALAAEHGVTEHQARHILDGTINGGSGTGGHVRDSPNIRIDSPVTDPVTGVVTTKISVWSPTAGRFKKKNAPTTFFPEEWSSDEVLTAVKSAFKNAQPHPTKAGQWTGVSDPIGDDTVGITIDGYYDATGTSWTTGWPA